MTIPFGRTFLEKIATTTRYPSFAQYGEYDESADLPYEIPPDKIVLGMSDRNFEGEPIQIPHRGGQQQPIIILGKMGSGKTTVAMNIIGQKFHRYGQPTLLVDPKREFYTHYQPNQKRSSRQLLKSLGLIPKGLPIDPITPKCCKYFWENSKTSGTTYSLEMHDFNRLPTQSERNQALIELFSVGQSDAAKRELYQFLDGDFKTFKEIRDKAAFTDEIKSPSLRSSIISMYDSGVIGNRDGKSQSIYIPERMQALGSDKPNYVVDLRLGLEAKTDLLQAMYLKMAISDVVNDRIMAKNFRRGNLTRAPLIAIDEADVFVPRNEKYPTKQIIEHLSTKYRAFSISAILLTQHPDLISETVIQQAHYVITSRLQSVEEKTPLRARGLSDQEIDMVMKDLYWEETDPVKEFAIIKTNGDYETFFALDCPSQMYRE